MAVLLPRADHVDVLLLLEGTYPYVAGGVSSWVSQILRGFPELRFGIIFIGSRPEDYGQLRYELPANLVHLETVYLFEEPRRAANQAAQLTKVRAHEVTGDPATMQQVVEMHELFHGQLDDPRCPQLFGQLMKETRPQGKLSREVFLHSKDAWEYIKRCYRERSTDPSFVDYFWTVRTLHVPFWVLQAAAENAPQAKVYHAVSTGYAGVLATLLKQLRGRPFMLSEHGIYVKERKIDLYQAQWVRDNRNLFERDPSQLSYFRQLWICFFEHLGYLAYQAADDIVALFEANRQRQLLDGAPAERTCNIPNGVAVAKLARLRRPVGAPIPPVLCLIGRVVPIKDVKTFIEAMRKVVNHRPDAMAWIAGPTDEDPEYALECQELVRLLGLEDRVQFLGYRSLDELLPQIGLMVLSSISEGLPLVVLEGFAAGIPALTTDVGSCRQLIEGLPGEDAALGKAGEVVRIANAEALADGALSLLQDENRWRAASQAAIRRVERYYTQEQMFAHYQQLYEKNLAWQG